MAPVGQIDVDGKALAGQYHVRADEPAQGAPAARVGEIAFNAGMPVHELVSESSSLEDIFLELTAEEPS